MINLFVSRLDYGVTPEDLTALFKAYGNVKKVVIPTDKETGKTKGFAFVEIDGSDAQSIIDALDGYSLNNRNISVKVAEERGDRPQRTFNNNERKPYNNSNSGGNSNPRFNNSNTRPESSNNYRSSEEPKRTPNFTPAPDADSLASKSMDRNKKKDPKKKSGGPISDGPKKGKMEAYKKSGKQNRFLYDDDEGDDDYTFEY